MKIALVGSSGYIAHYIRKKFDENVVKIDKNDEADLYLDLEAPDDFDYAQLDGIDYIIFTAAISGPDMCANRFDYCWNINVTGTCRFIDKAIERNCRVLFFSSDAVFGDIPGAIYDENSTKLPKTPYGKMKAEVENRYAGNAGFKAIRLSYVASANDRFVSYCLGCIEQNKTADVFHPFYRNCIVVSDVVRVVSWMVEHWDAFENQYLNVAGTELVSRVRIADELNRILSGKLNYTISMPDEEFYNNRPRITQMKSLYLNKYSILDDESFTVKLQREMEGRK